MAHIDVTDENFEKEVLKSDTLTLVDFWAGWCMPCQMLNPIITGIAEQMGDSVKICKLNVDENKEIAAKYKIMSIPAVFIFKNGEVVEEMIGLRQKEDYENAIKAHLDA